MRPHRFDRLVRFLGFVLFTGFAPFAAGAVTDAWAPQGAPAVPLKVPDPVSGTAPYPPVHATLLPDGRVMLFGKAGMRVKAASFTPTPFDQEPPP
ncbi:MAG TPA: hypothetical protein VE034_10945 [Burkholderiales bacterium]|nr:hypothetical protein [Burkholderiales bacterium]